MNENKLGVIFISTRLFACTLLVYKNPIFQIYENHVFLCEVRLHHAKL